MDVGHLWSEEEIVDHATRFGERVVCSNRRAQERRVFSHFNGLKSVCLVCLAALETVTDQFPDTEGADCGN